MDATTSTAIPSPPSCSRTLWWVWFSKVWLVEIQHGQPVFDRLKFNSWACFIVHGWGGEGISASKLVEGGKSIGRRRQLFRQLVRRCSLSCTRWAACGVLLLYGSPKYGILKQKDGRGAYWVFEMQYTISVVEGFLFKFLYGLWFMVSWSGSMDQSLPA